MNPRIATLMVHTSPLDQPGIGDAGGMNIYVVENAARMAAMGVSVDIFTRRHNSSLPEIVELSAGVRVRHLNIGSTQATKEGCAKWLLAKTSQKASLRARITERQLRR